MSHVLFILVCVIWGCSFILMKRAMLSFGTLDVALYRVVAGGAALWLIWAARRKPFPFHKRDFRPMFFIAAFGYALPFWVQPFVIGYSSSGFVGILVSLVPLLTILVSIPLLGAYPRPRQVLGVVGGLLCMLVLFGDEARRHVPIWVMVVGLATPLTYAVANTYIKRRMQHVPPTPLTAGAMTLAAVVLLPLAVTTEPVRYNEHFTMSVIWLLVLGVACTGIATAFFYTLIRDHGPLYASMVTYIIPCVALAIGWLDGEPMSLAQVGSLAGIFAMVALVQVRPRNGARVSPPV